MFMDMFMPIQSMVFFAFGAQFKETIYEAIEPFAAWASPYWIPVIKIKVLPFGKLFLRFHCVYPLLFAWHQSTYRRRDHSGEDPDVKDVRPEVEDHSQEIEGQDANHP